MSFSTDNKEANRKLRLTQCVCGKNFRGSQSRRFHMQRNKGHNIAYTLTACTACKLVAPAADDRASHIDFLASHRACPIADVTTGAVRDFIEAALQPHKFPRGGESAAAVSAIAPSPSVSLFEFYSNLF